MKDFILHIWDYLREIFVVRLPSFPIAIRCALFLIVFFTTAIAELYIFIAVQRRFLYYRLQRDTIWKNKFSNILGNMIVYGENETNEAIVQHFLPRFERMSIHRSSVRRILVQQLLEYRESFSGNTSQVLRDIYLGLNLDQYPKKKLRSRLAKDKAAAIRELSLMQVPGLVDLISAYADKSVDVANVDAYSALLRLDKVNPLGVLNTIQQPLSDWGQLMLFDAIIKTPGINIPAFSTWLASANDSIVLLCLKLIAHFQQHEAIPMLLNLLAHQNVEVRVWAVRVLGKLEDPLCEGELVTIYPNESLIVKSEILGALGKIASGEQIDFLRSCTTAPEFEIRNKARELLKAQEKSGTMLSNNTVDSNGVLHHALNGF
ncbi:MAG: hypothetical protein K0S09_2455 [Sphingobacteriaceae bacterium]|nr:hypothetical protein [Sphingobacteriaceae bacterium]